MRFQGLVKIGLASGNISKSRLRVALYASNSSDGHTTEYQLQEMEKIVEFNGWQITKKFVDHGISESKGESKRPAFNSMCTGIMSKEFDLIMAWSVDRLAKSFQHLEIFFNKLYSENIDLFLYKQGVNTTLPTGKIMFQMLSIFSDFERTMVKERINAGLTRAKAKGKKLGRPKVSLEVENKIKELRSTGKGIRKIASELRVGVCTVKRVVDRNI